MQIIISDYDLCGVLMYMTMSEKKKVIEIQNVKKRIGKKLIIDGISEDIYAGEVFGLLGPNGAGKTTLIKMIVGLMKISEGKILIEDRDIKDDYCHAVSKVRGLIEQPAMYPHLSGYDNLQVFAQMDKVNKSRINEVVDLIGLSNDIHRKVKEYSLGMKQRLGIGIALLSNPKVLILDEPTNGLDPEGIMELRIYLQKIAKTDEIAVIVSSHILAEMNQLCERFAIMKKGKLLNVIMKDEFVFEDNQLNFFIETDKAMEAYKLLQNKYNIMMKDGGIVIVAGREDIPDINKILVNEGVKVYGISTMENPLEKFYFDIINGKDEAEKND